jgi:4-hydroxy-L-threonine phosphate dehydrogenase PdxA
VVAAPQNETSIARAGIKFDGYPSFVARATGTDENDVYLMLCFADIKIVHATLHRSVRDAVAMITREKVIGVIGAAERALRLMGTAAPKIAVGGLNPHAGEGGLFGREEIDIIKPAIDAAVERGIAPPARSAPTPCFTCRASTPSSSCCTTRATSPPSCWRGTPPRR